MSLRPAPDHDAVAESLARLWADEGGVDAIDGDTDFFAAGGDSMGATLVAGALTDIFGVAVDVAEIYRHPLFADQVALVASKIGAAGSAATGADTGCPATQGQVGLFFRELLERAGESISVSRFARAPAGFDDARVEAAVSRLIERHESLRTALVPRRGGLELRVEAARDSYPGLVERIDGRLDPPGGEAAADPLPYRASHFDLKRAPLVHATISTLRDGSGILQLAVHHVAADGGSASLLMQEFAALYLGLLAGDGPALPRARPYLEFARRQHEAVAAGDYEVGATTVAGLLDGHVARHPRPVDFGPGAGAAGAQTDNLVVALEPCASGGSPYSFAAILAAFASVVGGRAGRDAVLFGVAAALCRASAAAPRVGMYVNLVPVRVPVSGDRSFAAQLALAERSLDSALQRADVPFELAMKRVGFRQRYAFEAFDFLLTEMRYPDRLGPGLEPVNVPAVRQVDMRCPSTIVRRCGDRAALVLEYSPRRMDRGLLAGILADVRALLAAERAVR